MDCPKCGRENALQLFTSTLCINKPCSNYDENHSIELKMKNFSYNQVNTKSEKLYKSYFDKFLSHYGYLKKYHRKVKIHIDKRYVVN